MGLYWERIFATQSQNNSFETQRGWKKLKPETIQDVLRDSTQSLELGPELSDGRAHETHGRRRPEPRGEPWPVADLPAVSAPPKEPTGAAKLPSQLLPNLPTAARRQEPTLLLPRLSAGPAFI